VRVAQARAHVHRGGDEGIREEAGQARGQTSRGDGGTGRQTSSIDESSADQSKKSKPAETRPKKTSFDDDAGDDAGDVNGTGDAKDPKKDNKKKRDDDARDKDDKKRKRTPKKASDVGKAPKRLRDPDAHLEYLARWSEAHQERGNGPTKGFKPSNGWKLDKNVQNWLIHNACDPDQVDEDAFDMFTMYAAGLRGGPLGRMRDAAGEENRGKGVKAERARKVLRVLADIVEDADS
jgi:Rab3 GTPase-activating protein catalytic subunit